MFRQSRNASLAALPNSRVPHMTIIDVCHPAKFSSRISVFKSDRVRRINYQRPFFNKSFTVLWNVKICVKPNIIIKNALLSSAQMLAECSSNEVMLTGNIAAIHLCVACFSPLAMDIYERLRANRDKLLETYRTNLEETRNLQATLIRDILPSVTGELNLSPDATEWAREWLSDTSSIFRIARRNKFTTSFALESIRKNLVWRLSTLWPPVAPIDLPNVHILPAHARDPFGRPTIVVEVMEFTDEFEVQKRLIFQAFEQCRQHLQDLHSSSGANEEPLLQYIVLCDLKKVSYQSLRLDVLTWTLREVIPRFPGMLAGVFMLNYSWAHSGVWSVVKHLLPEAALSRVFFPTQAQLISYFTPSALPEEYGGSLLSLTDTEGPSRTGEGPSPLHSVLPNSQPIPSTTTNSSVSSISPTSLLNPFFGYPVSSLSSPSQSPSFPHGRRRKRDLARTLILLLWLRWRSHITWGLCLITLALTINSVIRKRRIGSLRKFLK